MTSRSDEDPDSADIRSGGYEADPDPLVLLNDRQRIQQNRSSAIEESAVMVDEIVSRDAAIPRE